MSSFALKQLSPMIPSVSVHTTVEFLVAGFEFSIVRDDGGYAILHKDGFAIHVAPAASSPGEMSAYLEVDDVDACWAQVAPLLDESIAVRAPFDRDYGMREFHVEVPGTKTLLFVGQRLPEAPKPSA